jgi:NIMA (never in mitosis gene a)-related kinase
MSKKSEYTSKYKEMEIIGRGNFGSATLVRSLTTDQLYVAKKVLLGNLSQKEADGAHLELRLLKQLNHPNIVSYHEDFIEDGTMIIVMEYCEEGDLAYFIKNRATTNDYLEENSVLNWFLQILLALEYVHRQKILHRDIKSSNIFLTSNGTVKLGDFGISRVLENTNDAAMTVVGTPYYMSPEVCENKPYTYKSDVWALGCVLYELCTLKHAFSADNLLGLVFKIVREKNEPIPKHYTPELSRFVQSMLQKTDKSRPDVKEIFMMPFIQKTIEEFVRSDQQGLKTMIRIPIKKTQLHKEIKKEKTQAQTDDNMETVKSTNVGTMQGGNAFDATCVSVMTNHPFTKQNSQPQKPVDPYENMTAKQKMEKQKQEKRDAEELRIRNAIKNNNSASAQNAKNRKLHELQGNFGYQSPTPNTSQSQQVNGSPGMQTIHLSPGVGQGPNSTQNNFGVNNQNNKLNPQNTNFSQISNFSAFQGSGNPNNLKQMENNFLDVTNESMSLSLSQDSAAPNRMMPQEFGRNNQSQTAQQNSKNLNNPYNGKQDQNYSNYSNTIKTEYSVEYSQQVQPMRPTIQDDRPLPALKNKNGNPSSTATGPYEFNNNPGMSHTHKTGSGKKDDDEYQDDFEEYNSDDEENRLTLKAPQKELSDVMDLFKSKLTEGNKTVKNAFGLEEIKEQSIEGSNDSRASLSTLSTSQGLKPKDEQAISTKQTKINQVKDKAKGVLGETNFQKVYAFLKKEQELDHPRDYMKQKMGEIIGKDKRALEVCFDLEQIVFLEGP